MDEKTDISTFLLSYYNAIHLYIVLHFKDSWLELPVSHTTSKKGLGHRLS